MLHQERTWCVRTVASPEELAALLADKTWSCCTGFEIGGYLFLNDATCADGAQEYAIVKKPVGPGAPYVQIESLTASWMSRERLLEFICATLAGTYDDVEWAMPVSPRLEQTAEHARCCHCA